MRGRGRAGARRRPRAVARPSDELAIDARPSGRQPGHPAGRRLLAASSRTPRRGCTAGLTSQDVLDTALMLLPRGRGRRGASTDLAAARPAARPRSPTEHRGTAMVGRTLTQHAVPTTFGVKVAAVADRASSTRTTTSTRLAFPVQVGGAAGTRRGARRARRDPAARPARRALGLATRRPGTPTRRRSPGVGDALVATTDACGRIAARRAGAVPPEIGELTEGTGGGSSTMPHKHNPVLSVLVRRAALTTPAARRPPCTSPPPTRSTSAPTAPGTRSGRRCASSSAAPWSPPPRPPTSSRLRVHPTGWRDPAAPARPASSGMAELAGHARRRLPRRGGPLIEPTLERARRPRGRS